jgi:hypothetical protein
MHKLTIKFQLLKKFKSFVIKLIIKGVYDSDLIKALEALKMLQIDTG